MKEDLRIRKTKIALYEALAVLLKDNNFEEIRVQDICNIALINRSTFYAHYKDKYELLLDYIKIIKEDLTSSIKIENSELNLKEYFISIITHMLNHIGSKKTLYQSMLTNNQDSIILSIVKDVASHEIHNQMKKVNSSIPEDIIITFYLGGFISLCADWITTNKYSTEEIIEYMNRLLPDEINKL